MMFIPATTAPLALCTGTANERTPRSNCWSAIAKPDSRTSSRIPRSLLTDKTVRSVKRRNFTCDNYVESEGSGKWASRTYRIEVQDAGKRLPTFTVTEMMRDVIERAR